MKEKMKRVNVVGMHKILKEMSVKNSIDKRFKFAIHRNLEYLDPEMKSIVETQKPNSKFVEYENKRIAIGEQFADKDENGNPKTDIVNGNRVFIINENKDEANAKIVELIKEYNDVIEEKNEAMKQFDELMEEEIEVDVCKVSFEYLPEDADYSALKYIIKETPEEIEEKYL